MNLIKAIALTTTIGVTLAPTLTYALPIVVYDNDFSTSAGSEWSNNSIETAPSGENFLGRFLDIVETLTLNNLPVHTSATVAFRLYTIGSWDGNNTALNNGVVDGFTFDNIGLGQSNALPLNTTFSNFPGSDQDYPTIPSVGKTGAVAINSLQYPVNNGGFGGDAAYDFSFTFAHTSSTLIANWVAYINQAGGGLLDESWGLDNVVVSVDGNSSTSVPEPASLALLGIGLVGLAARRRRA